MSASKLEAMAPTWSFESLETPVFSATPLRLAGAGARGVHLGRGGHGGAVDAPVALEHVIREEAAGAQLGGARRQRAGAGGEQPLAVAVSDVRPPPHGWSASASIMAFATCPTRRLSSSRTSMAPSLNRGTASMSGVGSNKIPVAVFVLS